MRLPDWSARACFADLSTGGFTDGIFNATGVVCGSALVISTTQMPSYFPTAKIGGGNFLYVYETGVNWFGLSAATSVDSGAALMSGANISVSQAYNIDKKVDDGFPTTGNIVAVYLNGAGVPGSQSNAPNGNPDTASTCYNNSTNTYSTDISNGSAPTARSRSKCRAKRGRLKSKNRHSERRGAKMSSEAQ